MKTLAALSFLIPSLAIAEIATYAGSPYQSYKPQPKQEIKQPDLNDLIQKQTEVYQKLAEQQAAMLDEIRSLKNQQTKQLHMSMIDFEYRKTLAEEEFKKTEESYSFLGFSKESIQDFYKRIGLTDLMRNYNNLIKSEGEK